MTVREETAEEVFVGAETRKRRIGHLGRKQSSIAVYALGVSDRGVHKRRTPMSWIKERSKSYPKEAREKVKVGRRECFNLHEAPKASGAVRVCSKRGLDSAQSDVARKTNSESNTLRLGPMWHVTRTLLACRFASAVVLYRDPLRDRTCLSTYATLSSTEATVALLCSATHAKRLLAYLIIEVTIA